MFFKFFIFVSILTIGSYGQRYKSPREYGVEEPTTRVVNSTVNLQNMTSDVIKHLVIFNQSQQIEQVTKPLDSVEPELPWEPLACSNCLDERYQEHYKQKGCKPILIDIPCRKPCPKYFECPKKEQKPLLNGCEYKGKVYKIRDEVPVDNPCQKGCYCAEGFGNESLPEIRCASVDCFNNLKAPTPNCFIVYNDDECCGREKCLTEGQIKLEPKCLYDGREYRLGERIYPKEDPCLSCVCTVNWDQNKPTKSTDCKKVECDVHTNSNFKAGCLPIYHEKACCPIDYFCQPPEEQQCKFNGKTYLIGERLDIGRERTECTCVMPPDFTCIEKTAEEPKPDYVKKFQTLPKIDITNTSNNPFKGIPELKPNPKCPPFIPEGLTCAGVNCETVININGCQECKCEEDCPILKCRNGCGIYATTPGVCPQCQC